MNEGENILNKVLDFLMKIVFLVCACISIAAVITICLFMFANGVPAIKEIGITKFLFGTQWRVSQNLFGIWPMIVGSIYVTAGAMIIGVPIGLLTAVFLAKYCPKKLYKFIKPIINLMAGIPSIIYGFFGLVVIIPIIQEIFGTAGDGILAASILLGMMILPTIINTAESSIVAVPEAYYEGALALGATKERSIFKTVIPAAKSGVMSGIILGMGRAIGETMAVVMVAGNQAIIPDSITSGVRTLTANIVLEMAYATGLHRRALIATAVVLFVLKTNSKLKEYLRKPGSLIMLILIMLAAAITVGIMVYLVAYIVIRGVPYINADLFAWKYNSDNVSMTPAIINTIIIVAMTLIISVPIGVAAAIYLVEYAKRGSKLVKIIRVTTETLAGIPSIVFGLFGFLAFVLALHWGYSLIAGVLTLAIMVLPTIIRTTEEALIAVPDSFREGSFGLGAGKLRTIFVIVLPAAVPGILSGVILAIGRIVGESAALIFTAGSVAAVPWGSGKFFLSSTRTLAVHMYCLLSEGLYTNQAYATAVILLIIILIINGLSGILANKIGKENK